MHYTCSRTTQTGVTGQYAPTIAQVYCGAHWHPETHARQQLSHTYSKMQIMTQTARRRRQACCMIIPCQAKQCQLSINATTQRTTLMRAARVYASIAKAKPLPRNLTTAEEQNRSQSQRVCRTETHRFDIVYGSTALHRSGGCTPAQPTVAVKPRVQRASELSERRPAASRRQVY